MTDNIKRIDIKEFREGGYLQEVNRRFLHPLGLALEIVREDDGTERLGGVWDYRDDPEGMFFAGDYSDLLLKYRKVQAEWDRMETTRVPAMGYMVQPAEPPPDRRPHSRACGIHPHAHGSFCARDCPTCHGAKS